MLHRRPTRRFSDATKDLIRHMSLYIRDSLINSMDINRTMLKAFAYLPKGYDSDVIASDIVDKIIEQKTISLKLVPFVQVKLYTYFQKKGVENAKDLAVATIEPYEPLPHNVNLAEVRKITDDAIRSYLFETIRHQILLRLRHEKRYERLDAPDQTEPEKLEHMFITEAPTEAELEVQEQEEEFFDKAREVVRFRAEPQKRDLYLKVFDTAFSPDTKSLTEAAHKANIPPTTFCRIFKSIIDMIKKSPLTAPMIEEMKKRYQQQPVPDYREYLKDKSRSESLKDFLEAEKLTSPVYSLFAEGKSVDEIEKETGIARNFLRRYKVVFLDKYNKWYRKTQLKRACLAEILEFRWYMSPADFIRRVAYVLLSKEERDPYETFKKYIQNAIKRPDLFNIEIDFYSKFDNFYINDRPDKAQREELRRQDPKFRYEKYRVSLKITREIGNSRWDLYYSYEDKLRPDGSFNNTPEIETSLSRLDFKDFIRRKYDSMEIEEILTDHVKREFIRQGVNPHGGLSPIYYNTNPLLPEKYRSFSGVAALKERFSGLAEWADPVHKKRVEQELEKEQRRTQKRFSPQHEGNKAIKELSFQIYDLQEKLKTETDSKERKALEKLIAELEEKRKELTKSFKPITPEDIKKFVEEMKKKHYKVADEIRKIAEIIIAQMLPEPQVHEIQELFRLVKPYKTRINPRMWMNPSDLKLYAIELRRQIEDELRQKIKKIDKGEIPVADTKKKAREDAQRDAKDKIEKIKELIVKMPEDLRRRRNIMKLTKKEDYERYFARHPRWDPEWVDNETEVKKALNEVKELLEIKNLSDILRPEPPREKSIQMIDIREFETMERFLIPMQTRIFNLAEVLNKTDIKTTVHEDVIRSIEKEISTMENEKKELLNFLKEYREKELTPEEEKTLSKFDSELRTIENKLEGMKKSFRMYKKRPVINAAEALLYGVERFRETYSTFCSYLWFRTEGVVKYAASIPTIEELNARRLKDEIVRLAKILAGITPLRSRTSEERIKRLAKELKEKIKAFIGTFEEKTREPEEKTREPGEEVPETIPVVETPHPAAKRRNPIIVLESLKRRLDEEYRKDEKDKEKIKALRKQILEVKKKAENFHTLSERLKEYKTKLNELEKKQPIELTEDEKKLMEKLKENIVDTESYMNTLMISETEIKLAENLFERYKSIFPADELAEAERIADKLRNDTAYKHLNTLKEGFSKLYSEGLPTDILREVAAKRGTSEDETRLFLKNALSILVREGLREFIEKWGEIAEHVHAKTEKTPLHNRPPELYTKAIELLREHIPELRRIPLQDVEVDVLEFKPPEFHHINSVVEKLVREYSNDHNFLREIDRITEDLRNRGSFGRPTKAKRRHKPVKKNVPIGTWQELKKEIRDAVNKSASGSEIVYNFIAPYILTVRENVKNALKNNEPIDLGALVDGFVYILKQLYYGIQHLRAGGSEEAWRRRPGQTYAALPDIVIDSFEEAKKTFEKIKECYDVISTYIRPDQIRPRFDSEQYPKNLLDLYFKLKEEEEEKKKTVKKSDTEILWEKTKKEQGIKPSYMSYKVLQSFLQKSAVRNTTGYDRLLD